MILRDAWRRGSKLLCASVGAAVIIAACGSSAVPTSSPAQTSSADPPSSLVAPPSATPTTAASVLSATASDGASQSPPDSTSASPSAAASPPPTSPLPLPSASVLASPAGTPSVPVVGASRAQKEIDRLLGVLRADPNNGTAYRDLGVAMLQRVRETGDPSLYPKADEAFARARTLVPNDQLVLVGIGTLQLARHKFGEALVTARLALAARPFFPSARAVQVDALVELGRYDDAIVAVQSLVDERPDLAAYSRVSYIRELYGDLPGALEAMQQAQTAGADAPENVAFVSNLRGNLLNLLGRRTDAASAYADALQLLPGYAPAIASEGRLAVGRGDLATAIERFTQASAIVPLPEYVIALGEANEAAGNVTAARNSYDLARLETTLFKGNGVVVDLELALFEADHGDPAEALKLAQQAYKERNTIKTADALAWAQFKNGNVPEARRLSAEALKLGTLDPVLLYHAGAIAQAAGDTKAARAHLTTSLDLDPGFSATGAAAARALLAKLK